MGKNTKYNLFSAFLIYGTTLIILPQMVLYLMISIIGGFHLLTDIKNNKLYRQDIIFFVFVFLSIAVYFSLDPVVTTESGSLNDFFPYSVFLLTTIFFARHLNPNVFRFIFYFICFEILVGIVEYILGVPYIIKPHVIGETEFGESELLYFNRVFGLSIGVSIFGYKILVGFILLFYLKIKKYRVFYLGLLFVGLFITFNRTAMVGSLFFLVVYLLYNSKSIKIFYKIMMGIGFLALIYYLNFNWELVENQFFRGREVDLSGRENIFPYYLNFIENNWLLGNNFHKMWIEVNGRLYHAHNSYLQTLANMGILLFTVLWIYILSFFKKNNILYLVPILLYSSFQYGILWGVSFLDILFFFIIFNKTTPNK